MTSSSAIDLILSYVHGDHSYPPSNLNGVRQYLGLAVALIYYIYISSQYLYQHLQFARLNERDFNVNANTLTATGGTVGRI